MTLRVDIWILAVNHRFVAGPGGIVRSSKPHSSDVRAGRPSEDFPGVCFREGVDEDRLGVCLTLVLLGLGASFSRRDIDCIERVKELPRLVRT